MASKTIRLLFLITIILFLLPVQGFAQPSLEWVDLDEGMRYKILNSKVYIENVQTVYGYFHNLLKDLARACTAREIKIQHLETRALGGEEDTVVTFLVFITSAYEEKRIFNVHYSEDPGLWKEKIREAFLRDQKGIDGETCLWLSGAFESVREGGTFREMGEAEFVKLLEQKGHPEAMTSSAAK